MDSSSARRSPCVSGHFGSKSQGKVSPNRAARAGSGSIVSVQYGTGTGNIGLVRTTDCCSV